MAPKPSEESIKRNIIARFKSGIRKDTDAETEKEKETTLEVAKQKNSSSTELASSGGEGRANSTSPTPYLPNSTSGDIGSKPPGSKTTSAPTSPLRERSRASFLGKVTSLSQVVAAKVDQSRDAVAAYRAPTINKDRCFTLLVIDDQDTDWSKYFRGKKIQTDFDIRVEQAEFKELTVTASSEAGVTTSIVMHKSGNKLVRSFKPDFLLVRQNLRDASQDYKNLVLGFQYGGIPSLNTLESIYNFQDKPWVYAHMINLQRRLGKETLPLIDQTFYPSHKEMTNCSKFPCVFKIGHAHGGLGKVKVENSNSFQDMASVVAVSNTYCTVESYIEAKYDLHIFKIGTHYKAIMRKSLSGNWKTNLGQSILEEVPVTDKYKSWIDAVSELFGGLAICSLEVVIGRDGKEYIIEVNDSATTLMGDSQEDDRRIIADMVLAQMEANCKPSAPAAPSVTKTTSKTHISSEKETAGSPVPLGPAPAKEVLKATTSNGDVPKESPKRTTRRARRDSGDSTDSDASESSTVSGASSASSTVRRDTDPPEGEEEDKDVKDDKEKTKKQEVDENGDPVEGEDTMKNLRKTFAFAFGKN